jgi:hypothetical protein
MILVSWQALERFVLFWKMYWSQEVEGCIFFWNA